MDKDIQDIRRRAGINEEQVFTDKDAGFLSHRIKELQEQHKNWRVLNKVLVKFVLERLETAYLEGYQDGRLNPRKIDEILLRQPKEDMERLRKEWNVPKNYTDAEVMMFVTQQKNQQKNQRKSNG